MRISVTLCLRSVVVLLVPLGCDRKVESQANASIGVASRVPPNAQSTTPADPDLLEISYGWSDRKDEAGAVAEALGRMKETSSSRHAPKVAIVLSTGTKYSEPAVHAALKGKLDPSTKIWGMATTERGLLTPAGRHLGISTMGIYAPEMKVGVGQVPIGDWKDYAAYRDVGKRVILAALKDAGYAAGGPKPNVVLFAGLNFLTDTKIFRGIEDVIGKDVPIIGGNSVEETWEMAGGWGYSTGSVSKNVITVAAIWADRRIGVAYGYGYKKTQYQGIVTKSDAENRIIYEINGKPAATVYNEWVGGRVATLMNKGGPIPFEIFAEYPFSKPIGDDPADYVMLAPLKLNPDKSIFVSHEGVEEGKQISVYKLDNEDVVVKPAIVASLAMARGGISPEDLAGSLMLYCDAPFAGGKAVMDSVAGPFFKRTHKPFLGFFASGEVGYSPRGGNRMLAYSTVVLAFGKSR